MITRLQQVQHILKEHPRLHDGGYGELRGRCHRPRTNERAALLSPASVRTIDNIVVWLALRIEPTRTINRRHTSYGLKHIYEAETSEYCSNGQFITAALLCGYGADFSHYNPCFAMSERCIRRAWDIAHGTPHRRAWTVSA